MAIGIEFYKSKIYDGFENCEDTVEFTKIINNLFDALNRKFPAEGIKSKGKDLEWFGILSYVCCMLFVVLLTNIRKVLYITTHHIKYN